MTEQEIESLKREWKQEGIDEETIDLYIQIAQTHGEDA